MFLVHNDRLLFKDLTTFILAICEKSHLVFSHSCFHFQFFQYPFTKKHYKVIILTSYSICYQYFLNMFFQLKFYILKFPCLWQKIDGFQLQRFLLFLTKFYFHDKMLRQWSHCLQSPLIQRSAHFICERPDTKYFLTFQATLSQLLNSALVEQNHPQIIYK